jgi:xanthine dehydrogenase YagS FAD-binding subunit
LKERQAFDFALVSVAAMVAMKGDAVTDAHIVFGGVAPFPLRATGAEAALKGKKIAGGMAAACEAAVKGAEPLSNNGYKVKATKGLLEQALSSLA